MWYKHHPDTPPYNQGQKRPSTVASDQFNGIGKFEGGYHIVTDPDVPPAVHAPRKCLIHITDDIKKELDKMVSLGVIQPGTEPTDWVSSVAYSQNSSR